MESLKISDNESSTKVNRENTKTIIKKLVHFKSYPLICTVIDLLDTEEKQVEFLEWIEKNENCTKGDVDYIAAMIAFKKE